MRWLVILAAMSFAAASYADDVGQIKNLRGAVHVERDGQKLAAASGMGVRQSDVLVTGADGSVGVTFLDNSLLSIGPGSALAIDRYSFDSTTHDGHFDASLKRGTLAVVSGRIVKRSPEAMRVRTPSAIMGVRGTEFVVKVEEPAR
ncbi:MAG TPA: FecR family protein [Burkholderiales bacterium]|nr:FecR family protein [Burkholderiales bacterium]